MGCFSGRLMSAASDQKLFCELCSAFNCSFDEFVGEKVVSPSYSSAILTPPSRASFSTETYLTSNASCSAVEDHRHKEGEFGSVFVHHQWFVEDISGRETRKKLLLRKSCQLWARRQREGTENSAL